MKRPSSKTKPKKAAEAPRKALTVPDMALLYVDLQTDFERVKGRVGLHEQELSDVAEWSEHEEGVRAKEIAEIHTRLDTLEAAVNGSHYDTPSSATESAHLGGQYVVSATPFGETEDQTLYKYNPAHFAGLSVRFKPHPKPSLWSRAKERVAKWAWKHSYIKGGHE